MPTPKPKPGTEFGAMNVGVRTDVRGDVGSAPGEQQRRRRPHDLRAPRTSVRSARNPDRGHPPARRAAAAAAPPGATPTCCRAHQRGFAGRFGWSGVGAAFSSSATISGLPLRWRGSADVTPRSVVALASARRASSSCRAPRGHPRARASARRCAEGAAGRSDPAPCLIRARSVGRSPCMAASASADASAPDAVCAYEPAQ